MSTNDTSKGTAQREAVSCRNRRPPVEPGRSWSAFIGGCFSSVSPYGGRGGLYEGLMCEGTSPILERNEKMTKILAGVAIGVFVGAMVAEIIRKTNPQWFQKLQARLTKSAKAAKEAFVKGYAGTETA